MDGRHGLPADPATQGTPRGEGEQGHPSRSAAGFTVADALTLARIPLALAFLLVPHDLARLGILLVAAATDLLDGALARRLAWYEIAGVLLRDLVATIAFLVTYVSGRPMAIPARLGGKAVTVAQVLTVIAFLTDSALLRPLAWATGAIALYAIWDYNQAAPRARRPVGR